MTEELQSTLEASGIEWPAVRNHIPCMAHVIQLVLGAVMSSLSVKGHTKSWEAHQHDQQFGENESMNIGKSQRYRNVGNARINKVSAMRPGLAKIIDKVWISRHLGTNLDTAKNDYSIDYPDTGMSKQVHWRWKSQSTHCNTSYDGCEESLEFNTEVAWASLPNTRIHLQVASESKIQWLPATHHNTGWMHHHQVRHGRFETIQILDPVGVQEASGYLVTAYHCLQWHVRTYGWRYASFS